MGHFLPFVLQNFPHYVGDLQVFASYPEPIPTYVPGWGGSGFTLTGALRYL